MYFRCWKKDTNRGGQFTPLIRNISAVVFGVNSMEYKPRDIRRIIIRKRLHMDYDKKCVFLGFNFFLEIISGLNWTILLGHKEYCWAVLLK